jgi:Fe2+ or Zn2+ uptake regulation protein
MIAGSSFLRSFYDTGIMFYRPDPKVSNNALMQFEVRNRRTKEPWAHDIKIILDRDKNTFITEQIEVDPEQRKDLKKLHKELRVQQQLVELIENEAREGRIYTIQKFAETFENQYGLLGAKTVIRKLNTLAQKQIVKFFNNPEEYGLVFERAYKTRSMFMCMSEEMELKTEGGNVYVRPNYYKSAVDGSFCEL